MSKQLLDNLNEIKNQKDTYLLPENIKKDVTVLGITGTYEGSGGNLNDALVYSTKAELEADINNNNIPLGKKAIAYGVELLDTIEVGTGISVIKSVEKNFTLDTAITESISIGISDYEVEGNISMTIDGTSCILQCGSEYGPVGVQYLGYWTSEDGLNYIGQTEYTYYDWMTGEQKTVTITYGETVFPTMRYNEDNKTDDNAFLYDLLKQLVTFGAMKYNGIYEYTNGNYMNFLGKYAYKAELVKNGSYYDIKNNDNNEWINVRDLGKKIIQLLTDNEIELASTEVIVALNDYDNSGINTCQVYVPSGKYVKYRSNIIVFNSLNQYYIGKDDSSLDGLDSCYVYTCDFVNKTVSSSTISARLVSTTDYSGEAETKPIIDKNFYNDKIININLNVTTPDNCNVSSRGYYDTYGYRLNRDQRWFNTMSDGKAFNPSITQFTMSTYEQENMLGSYTVLGKDGECVSTGKWPAQFNNEHWLRLLPSLNLTDNFTQDIGYGSVVIPGRLPIEADKSLCRLTYKKLNELINKFLHDNDNHTRFGYRSGTEKVSYTAAEGLDVSSINANNILYSTTLDNGDKVGLTKDLSWCKWNDDSKTLLNFASHRVLWVSEAGAGSGVCYAENVQKHDDIYYVGLGNGYNSGPDWSFGVVNITTGELVDVFTIDPENTLGSAMGNQGYPVLWFTEGQVPSLATLQGYGSWISGSTSTSNRTAKLYKLTNGKLSVVYTGPTAYNTSIYGDNPDKTVIIGTKSSSSANYVYNLVLPSAFAKTVYNPTSKRMPDGTTAYCYYKTQMTAYEEDELYCIWNNAEVKYNTLEIPPVDPAIITIDNIDYVYTGSSTSINSYTGKLTCVSDNTEVEIATPKLTATKLTTKNSYQYTEAGVYNVSSNEGFVYKNNIYTACEFSQVENINDITMYDMLVMATSSASSQEVYSNFLYKMSGDNLDLLLELDTKYEGTVNPTEYNEAITTADEILGEE